MDDPEGSREAGGISLNGLVEKEAAFVTRVLNAERMKQAELIAARIISGIQPNQTSEQRRKGIISYVQRIITKCFSCQVISFGSVPLKTYLPDGDIDITVRSDNPTLSDSVINRVLNVLLNEEKSKNAELRVKDVRYIQAEVKIIKCLIENIVVDISFNQLGGLRTLFFLEKVDNLINGNHLFKRSVILTKAWCFYESRILGAHHGLISTYALEILVLYIFLVFDKKFSGPLEVLYRFLELFSKFDWGNFCISLRGPVPISSIPNVASERPRKDCLELPLTKLFCDVCNSVKDAFPSGQENQEQFFAPKYFNVIDPLRENNNLGRSVSEGNFYRIRSAFAFGAEQLGKLLDCPREDLLINSFFRNTSGGHGRGQYPGAPGPRHIGQKSMRFNQGSASEGFRNDRGGEKPEGDLTDYESTAQLNHLAHASDVVLLQNKNHWLKQTSRTGNFSEVSCDLGQKSRASFHRSMLNDQNKKKIDCLRNKVHVRCHFAGNNMIDSYSEVPQLERQIMTPETGNSFIASGGSANESICSYPGILESRNTRFPRENSFSSSHRPAHNLINGTTNSKGTFNDNFSDRQARRMIGEHFPERFTVHQIDKDFVKTLPFNSHGLDGKNQMPMHSTYGGSLCPIRSLDYAKIVVDTMRPRDESSKSSWSLNRQQSQGYLPVLVSKNFPGKITPEHAGTRKLFSRKAVPPKSSQEDGDRGHLSFKVNPVRFLDHKEGRFQARVREELRQHKDSSHVTCSGNFFPRNHKIISENQYLARGYHGERVQGQRNREISVQTSSCLRSIPSSQGANLNGKPSSSRYCNRFPMMSNKFQKYKWQKKSEISRDISLPRGMDENELQGKDKSIYSQVSNNSQGSAPCSTIGYETKEILVSHGMAALNIQMHASSCYVPAPVTCSTPMIPALQMFVDPHSDGRVDRKHEALQLKSHVTSPSVPFLTTIPLSDHQSDKGTKTSFAENFDRGKQFIRPEVSVLCQDFNSTEAIQQQELSNASKIVKDLTSTISSEDHKSDFFNGDVRSHGRNLQQYDGLPFHPHSHVQVQPMDLKENIPCNIGSSAANVNLLNQSRPNPPYPFSCEDQKYCKSGNSRSSGSYGRRDYYFNCQGNWNKILKPGIGDHNRSQTHQPTKK